VVNFFCETGGRFRGKESHDTGKAFGERESIEPTRKESIVKKGAETIFVEKMGKWPNGGRRYENKTLYRGGRRRLVLEGGTRKYSRGWPLAGRRNGDGGPRLKGGGQLRGEKGGKTSFGKKKKNLYQHPYLRGKEVR